MPGTAQRVAPAMMLGGPMPSPELVPAVHTPNAHIDAVIATIDTSTSTNSIARDRCTVAPARCPAV